MTRRRKFLTAGAILVLGFVLAWPFRKADTNTAPVVPTAAPPADTLRASNGDPIAALQTTPPAAEVPEQPTHVVAQMASTSSSAEPPKATGKLQGFDIANHPALIETASAPPTEKNSPVTEAVPATTQPAYSTAGAALDNSLDEWPVELVHVVANGDTLEKLAQRYLNDAGRALEIFDLNRDQLSNPHLLPIGVELRVPRNPNRIVD